MYRLNEELQPMYDEHVQRGVSGVEVVSDSEGYATNFCTQVIFLSSHSGLNAACGEKKVRILIQTLLKSVHKVPSQDCFR